LKLQALDCRHWIVVVIVAWSDPARLTRDLIAVQFDSTQILPYVAVNKTRSPTVQRMPLAASFRLPKQAQVSSVAFQAQYQAFVRFAVEAAQLSKAIALNQDLRFGTFRSGRALALRTLASTRSIYGASNPGPMLCSERNRSRRIFQVVFLHSSWAL
jgi:hypothetical protein